MLDVKWPKEDLDAVESAINRAIRVGKRDVEGALKQTGVYLARSAAASTKSAPKKRRAKINRDLDKDFPSKLYPYYREVWKDGPEDTFNWYLKDKDDATWMTIKKAGLAKKSFRWMIPAIRYRPGGNFAHQVEKRSRGIDYEIEMSNKLPYIAHALKGEGDKFFYGALGRAAKQMEKDTDRRLARMTR